MNLPSVITAPVHFSHSLDGLPLTKNKIKSMGHFDSPITVKNKKN
jgi:hypothetical protein